LNPAVQINQHRRQLRRVGDLAVGLPQARAQRVELHIANRVVMRPPVHRVRFGQGIELPRDLVRPIAHDLVAANQIRVRVDQHRVVIPQSASAAQVEEDCAAAEERLDIPVERVGIEAA